MDIKLSTKTIRCVDCGQGFKFSIGEQAYFLSKHLSDPKRCLDCRKDRRRSLELSRLADGGNGNG